MAKDSLTQLRKDFNGIAKSLQNIEKKLDGSPENPEYILRPLDPIVATYETAGKMGKWVMTSLVIVSLVVGIVWGLAQIAATKASIIIP